MIYVDDMSPKAEVPNGKHVVRGKWSHLYADTHDELMTMAQLIGLNPDWIQHPGTDKEHFDVVQSKRAAAIKAGARPVSWRHAGEFFAARRKAADAERQAEAENPYKNRTAVVNLKGHRDDPDYADVIYVGRAWDLGGWRLSASPFANPYRIGRDGTRNEVIARYREHLLASPDLLAMLPQLRGKRLGCFCAPEPCHADVVAELADESARPGAGRETANPDLIPRGKPVDRVLLVTGPRKGVPRAVVEAALKPLFSPTTLLVEGEADGVDKDSASLWESWGGLVERHAVSREEWDANPKGAGHARNRRMVARLKAGGNGQVLAIDLPCTKDECKGREPHNTHGTSGCVAEAEKAGLQVDHFKAAGFLAGQQVQEVPATGKAMAVDLAQAAREADKAARDAFGKGAYDRALTWLATAKELDPGNAALFEQHERQVKTAMPFAPQRRGCSRCGEPGSQYPNGDYRCDSHKPEPTFKTAQEVKLTQEDGECPTCQTANLTYGRTQCQACGIAQLHGQREERQPA